MIYLRRLYCVGLGIVGGKVPEFKFKLPESGEVKSMKNLFNILLNHEALNPKY